MLSAFHLRRNFISLAEELSRRFDTRNLHPYHHDAALAMEMEHRGASVALVHEATEPCNHFVIECHIDAPPALDQRATLCRMLALNRDYIRAGLGSFSICLRRDEPLITSRLRLDGVTADKVVNTLDALVYTSASWSEVPRRRGAAPMAWPFAVMTIPSRTAPVLDMRDAFIDLVAALAESNDDIELLELHDDGWLCVRLTLLGRHFELSHSLPQDPYLASHAGCRRPAPTVTMRRCSGVAVAMHLRPVPCGLRLDEGSDRIVFIQAFDLEADACGGRA